MTKFITNNVEAAQKMTKSKKKFKQNITVPKEVSLDGEGQVNKLAGETRGGTSY